MKDKKFLLWTSLLTILPMLAGLLLWSRLPEQMPTHFGATGQADGWSGRTFAVFGIPAIMLAVHWLCIGGMWLDRRNVGHNQKITKVILMTFPVISNVLMATVYAIALGWELNITAVTTVLLGVLFIAMGNYLPKCRRNSTLGIKIKWTLYNDENWNRTHRFGGKVYVLAGVVFLFLSFLPAQAFMGLMLAAIIAIAVLPMVYSYLLYKKQVADGTWVQSSGAVQPSKSAKVFSAIALVLALALVAGVLITGRIDITCADDALVIDASFWEDLTIPYDEIDSVEYRETAVDGLREMGYGSPRLLLGLFRNDEFGSYTRYTYTGDGPCVILRSGDDVLVLGAKTAEETRALYEELAQKVA